MNYKIVVGTNPQTFEREINEYIENGWAPQGGVFVNNAKVGDRVFYQALINYQLPVKGDEEFE